MTADRPLFLGVRVSGQDSVYARAEVSLAGFPKGEYRWVAGSSVGRQAERGRIAILEPPA